MKGKRWIAVVPLLMELLLIGALMGWVFQAAKPPSSEWLNDLPECPCTAPTMNDLNDGWAKDRGNTGYYHAGATLCFRSYPTVHTSEGQSGQQCCYDENGKLITQGPGAGTPDRAGTCLGENEHGEMVIKYSGLLLHLLYDVRPFEKEGWEEYNKHWAPSKGNNCEENVVAQ